MLKKSDKIYFGITVEDILNFFNAWFGVGENEN